MGALLDFFSLEHQAELICNAQLLDQYYENILIEYGKLFIGDLIKCYQIDQENGETPGLCECIKRLLDQHPEKDIYDFSSDIMSSQCETREVGAITECFLLIRECYHCWTSCDLEKAIGLMKGFFYDKLNIDVNGVYFSSFINNKNRLYRGRLSESSLDKIDMFHIPFKQAYKMRNQRFSITGQPLLYLADNVSGVFNELALDSQETYQKLFISQYKLNKTNNELPVFDLRINAKAIIEERDQKLFEAQFYKFMLSCVCSFPNVRGRENSIFVEEYVIPQLVTQLIRKNEKFCGICYNTVHIKNNQEEKSKKQKEEPYTNYALFTSKRNMDDSIDTRLRDLFFISSPVTVAIIQKYHMDENCETTDIVRMIRNHFDKIENVESIFTEIQDSQFFEFYNKDVEFFYRDGKYRYVKCECPENFNNGR